MTAIGTAYTGRKLRMMARRDPLARAVLIMGGGIHLGAAIGVCGPTVHTWFTRGVPAGHWKKIEEVTGGRVTVAQLRRHRLLKIQEKEDAAMG